MNQLKLTTLTEQDEQLLKRLINDPVGWEMLRRFYKLKSKDKTVLLKIAKGFYRQ